MEYNGPKQDSNLGSISHRLNYEAATLTIQPPWLDTYPVLTALMKFPFKFFGAEILKLSFNHLAACLD